MAKVAQLVVAVREKPTIRLSEKDLPAIKNWKVGGKYCLVLDVEEVEATKNDYEPGYSARFRVTKVRQEDEDDES